MANYIKFWMIQKLMLNWKDVLTRSFSPYLSQNITFHINLTMKKLEKVSLGLRLFSLLLNSEFYFFFDIIYFEIVFLNSRLNNFIRSYKFIKGGERMNFFKQVWVQVVAFIFIIIGVVILILGGVTTGEINNVVELIAGIISAIGLLIVAIRQLLQKKDSTNK